MFFENESDIPESLKEQFVESEFDGKKGWQDKEIVALRNSMVNAKKERDEYKTKFSEVEGKLSEFEKTQAEKIEKAKAEALEKAKSAGDVEAIEKRYKEKMEDLEKRVREEERKSVTSELKTESAKKQASDIADKIGLSIGVDQDCGEAIADLIRSRVEVDPSTGEEIYKDAKGGALSVDRKAFVEELKKEARFKRLIKGETPSKGGGMANGSGGGGAGSDSDQAADKAKKDGDVAGFLNARFKKG